MRTGLFLLSGFLLLAAFLILARLFSDHYPRSSTWATITFVFLWLVLIALNLWVGVTKAGYSVAEELPIQLFLFCIPVAVAIFLKWKVL